MVSHPAPGTSAAHLSRPAAAADIDRYSFTAEPRRARGLPHLSAAWRHLRCFHPAGQLITQLAHNEPHSRYIRQGVECLGLRHGTNNKTQHNQGSHQPLRCCTALQGCDPHAARKSQHSIAYPSSALYIDIYKGKGSLLQAVVVCLTTCRASSSSTSSVLSTALALTDLPPSAAAPAFAPAASNCLMH